MNYGLEYMTRMRVHGVHVPWDSYWRHPDHPEDDRSETWLHAAAMVDRADLARELLAEHPDLRDALNASVEWDNFGSADSGTLLLPSKVDAAFLAAAHGSEEVFKLLVPEPDEFDPNAGDEHGRPPLMFATADGAAFLCRTFGTKLTLPDPASDHFERHPLAAALHSHNDELALALLNRPRGFSLTTSYGFEGKSFFHVAASELCSDAVLQQMKSSSLPPFDVDEVDARGQTALRLVSTLPRSLSSEKTRVIKCLLNMGCSPAACTVSHTRANMFGHFVDQLIKMGESPVEAHHSLAVPAVKALFANIADEHEGGPNDRQPWEQTPLHNAAQDKHANKVLQLGLQRSGHSVDYQQQWDTDGLTPLDYAADTADLQRSSERNTHAQLLQQLNFPYDTDSVDSVSSPSGSDASDSKSESDSRSEMLDEPHQLEYQMCMEQVYSEVVAAEQIMSSAEPQPHVHAVWRGLSFNQRTFSSDHRRRFRRTDRRGEPLLSNAALPAAASPEASAAAEARVLAIRAHTARLARLGPVRDLYVSRDGASPASWRNSCSSTSTRSIPCSPRCRLRTLLRSGPRSARRRCVTTRSSPLAAP